MQRKVTLTDTRHTLPNCAQEFKEDYVLCFVDVRIRGILEDMKFSDFLAANLRAAYIRYIGVGKIIVENQVVLSLLAKLGKDAKMPQSLGITHFNNPIVYICSEEDVLLIIQVGDGLNENDHKHSLCTPIHFIDTAGSCLMTCRIAISSKNKNSFYSLRCFLISRFSKPG